MSAALPSPPGGHDRDRVLADLACAIADGPRVIIDFRVMGGQRELFGPVASVPAAWRALKEAAAGGDRARRKVTAAVNLARRHARAQAGPLPPVRIADLALENVTCIRMDATVVPAQSDKELAEADFKGYGTIRCSRPAITRASRWPGCSAGSNTAADHLRLLRETLSPALRRRIMVTYAGAGVSHDPVKELDRLASRHGYQVTWSVGWTLGAASRPRSARSPSPPGKPPTTARAKSASGVPSPAGTHAARTRPAGSRKRTPPS